MLGQDIQNLAIVITAIAALVTALVGLRKLFKSPKLKLTWAAGVWLVFAFILGCVSSAFFLMAVQGTSTAKPSAEATSSAVPNTSDTVPEVPSAGGSTVTVPLEFVAPQPNSDVGKVVSVTLRGAVPAGEQLWIVVQSSGEYYVQGKPDRQGGDTWFLPGVNLGSNSPLDNGLYTIMAVMASPESDAKLQQELDATNGETGVNELPGEGGAEPLSVTVNRTHL